MNVSGDKNFISRITGIVLDNLADQDFGVEALIRKSGLSHYKLSKILRRKTGKRINRFIREIRLEKALELLKDDSLTIAEIAYQTGFGSPPYFNKCFHEFYGYTPGEIRNLEGIDPSDKFLLKKRIKSILLRLYNTGMVAMLLVILTSALILAIRRRIQHNSEQKNIAVMPFQNLTNDPEMNIWQSALQQNLITELAGTGEVNVILEKSVVTFLQNKELAGSQLSFSLAKAISHKLNADYFIMGSFLKVGEQVRIDASMCETRRTVVLESFEVNGSYNQGNAMFNLIDSLRDKVTQYMLISKIISKNPYYQHSFTAPRSVEALKYYNRATKTDDPSEQITLYKKSLAADSTFYQAALSLEYAYSASGNADSSRIWLIKNYHDRDKMSDYDRLYASWAYAYTFQSYDERIKDLSELVQMDKEDPGNHYLLGLTYCLSGQYEKAVPELEISLKIYERWGDEFLSDPMNYRNFKWLGIAYNNTDQPGKQRRLNKKAEKFVKYPWMDLMKSTYLLSLKDTTGAIGYIEKARNGYRKYFGSQAYNCALVGDFLKNANKPLIAEKYYRKALELEPDNMEIILKFVDYCFHYDKHCDPELMDRAIKLCKNRQQYYELLSEKGMCLFLQGDRTKALDTIQKAWDEAPFKVYRIRHYLDIVQREGYAPVKLKFFPGFEIITINF